MAAFLFGYEPRYRAISATGAPIPGAILRFSVSPGTTPTDPYSDSTLTTPVSTMQGPGSAEADSGGLFPAIFLSSEVVYRVRLFTSAGVLVWDQIDYSQSNDLTQSEFNTYYALTDDHKRTAAEIAAGVTPTNYAYSPGVIDRYGTNTTPGTTDMSGAIESAIAVAAAGLKRVEFLPAVYATSTAHNFSINGAWVGCADARATIRYTGSGTYAAAVDGGTVSIKYGHVLENLDIEGNSTAGIHGLFIRNHVHRITRNVRVRNARGKAFFIQGDVLSTYEDCFCTDNEPETVSYIPDFGLYLDGSALITSTTACNFLNCAIECANDTGVYLNKSDNNNFIGGSSEGLAGGTGNDGLGIYSSANSLGNLFENFFCEANYIGGDLVEYGKRNKYVNCVMSSLKTTVPYESVKSIIVKSGAEQNRFEGGECYAVTVESGALDTFFDSYDSSYAISDSGTRTVITKTRQLFNSSSIVPIIRGSFTPTWGGSTTNGTVTNDQQTGVYVLKDGICSFTLNVRASVVTAAPTGDLYVRGLPFTAASGFNQAVSLSRMDLITLPASRVQITAEVVDGSQAIRFSGLGSALAASYVPGSGLAVNGVVCVSGSYFVG